MKKKIQLAVANLSGLVDNVETVVKVVQVLLNVVRFAKDQLAIILGETPPPAAPAVLA